LVTGLFERFESTLDGAPKMVKVRVREDVTADSAKALAQELAAVPWSHLAHAYGPADDVPTLLYAVAVGDAATRKDAWWELWGNVHHQGTVYEATTPAVRFIAAVAKAGDYPDRVQALSFLRQLALGDGAHAAAVREAVGPHAVELVEGLSQEPELVQRAVVWLSSAFPSLAAEHDLVRLVPPQMRETWDEVLERVRQAPDTYDEEDDAAFDREDALERWALSAWT
jgi:hypothetical protein